MEAAKAIDAYGFLPDNDIEQADAEQAYVQAAIQGPQLWISLPKESQPRSWQDYRRPVCLLKKALYGHPDSGTYWEEHCDAMLTKQGFTRISDWQSCYLHKPLNLFLIVYVDDFKLAGPRNNLHQGWTLIRQSLNLDPPQPLSHFLGCTHHKTTTIDPKTNATVTTIRYDMKNFLLDAVKTYESLTEMTVKPSSLPFLKESTALRILMKLLYAARTARYDLLRPVTKLAREVSRWSQRFDQQLHKLMSYVMHSAHLCLHGYIGDSQENLKLQVYCDADFAGTESQHSTTGVHTLITAHNSNFPLMAISKKQTSVSTSTTEAELTALFHALKNSAIPAKSLWESLLARPVQLEI